VKPAQKTAQPDTDYLTRAAHCRLLLQSQPSFL
jgi:hypothetical protein